MAEEMEKERKRVGRPRKKESLNPEEVARRTLMKQRRTLADRNTSRKGSTVVDGFEMRPYAMFGRMKKQHLAKLIIKKTILQNGHANGDSTFRELIRNYPIEKATGLMGITGRPAAEKAWELFKIPSPGYGIGKTG